MPLDYILGSLEGVEFYTIKKGTLFSLGYVHAKQTGCPHRAVLSSIPRSASHCWRAIHAQLDFVLSHALWSIGKEFQSCGPARTVSDLNKDAGASLPRLKCRKEASAQQTMNLWVPCLVRRPVPSSKQAGRRGTAILGLTKAGNGSAAKEVISYPLFGLSKDREARLLSVMTFPVNFHYSIVTEKPVEIDCFALLYIEESCRE
ncbi:hypothetical protein L1987_89115 [Smallanthus sonchifolius]|nr:hypothetical protein L1987_89115 [Smallanthus sonchifolius]